MRSLASFRDRLTRLFSRASHSSSTSIAKRSSKLRSVAATLLACSSHAAAMAGSRMACSFSIVGSLNMWLSFNGSSHAHECSRGQFQVPLHGTRYREQGLGQAHDEEWIRRGGRSVPLQGKLLSKPHRLVRCRTSLLVGRYRDTSGSPARGVAFHSGWLGQAEPYSVLPLLPNAGYVPASTRRAFDVQSAYAQ